MAFAHGANDVANAIGPLGAVVNILRTGVVVAKTTVPAWILALGGFGIVVGLATWGWRVIETVGKRITELTPTRGFSAEFSAALTIVLATRFGFPISTTHTLVGAVLGVGLARGIGAINLNTIRDIVISWIVTIPAGAMISVIFFYILRYAFSG
jgi:phosphate/sulfate permease